MVKKILQWTQKPPQYLKPVGVAGVGGLGGFGRFWEVLKGFGMVL